MLVNYAHNIAAQLVNPISVQSGSNDDVFSARLYLENSDDNVIGCAGKRTCCYHWGLSVVCPTVVYGLSYKVCVSTCTSKFARANSGRSPPMGSRGGISYQNVCRILLAGGSTYPITQGVWFFSTSPGGCLKTGQKAGDLPPYRDIWYTCNTFVCSVSWPPLEFWIHNVQTPVPWPLCSY